MRLEHEFTVPVPVDDAWKVLLDIERVAPCMPGATVDSLEGDTISGNVKVKVGPVTVTYRGTATFQEKDESAHRVVLAASGKEARGAGTARATVTGSLAPARNDGGAAVTTVSVVTDLTITGRPAQFGRGVMAEVGDKIIGQFAACLSDQLAGGGTTGGPGETGTAGEGTAEPAEQPAASPAQPEGGTARAEVEPIDLVGTAGIPVIKRVAVALGAVGLVALLLKVLRRRR